MARRTIFIQRLDKLLGKVLKCVYEARYKDKENYVQEVKTFFEEVMESTPSVTNDSTAGIHYDHFKNIKGIYFNNHHFWG